MKRKIYHMLMILLSFNIALKGQDNNQAAIDNQYSPKIFGVSPQAAALAKVADIPVDISTGRIGYNIPLFEIKEGSFSLPVNLSYNYSGLLLDETPGYAGVGWTFNIGGAIVHTVKGLNDEYNGADKAKVDDFSNHRPPYDTGYTVTNSSPNYLILMGLLNGLIDGEADKYTMNIGNINASFYLDKNNVPIFLKNENYKVFPEEGIKFKVVDDKGISYIFSKLSMGHTYGTELVYPDYVASYLVTEIDFPNSSNKIIFEYEDNAGELLEASISQTKVVESTQASGVVTTSRNVNSYSSNGVKTPLLTKITTSNSIIEITYDKHPTEKGVAVITGLTVKNSGGNVTDYFILSYSDWIWRRRNLEKVTHNDIPVAKMEYDMDTNYPVQSLPSMPSPNSYVNNKKDLWGYYNSNTQSVTNSTEIYDRPSMKPNFKDTKIGSLIKITYPTKGYSVISYEQNVVLMTGNPFPYDTEGTKYMEASSVSKAVGESNETTFVISTNNGTNEVKVTSILTNDPNYPVGEEIRTAETSIGGFKDKNTWLWSDPAPTNTWQPSPLYKTTNKTIYLLNGNYTLKSNTSYGCTAKISASVKYTLPEYNQPVGGIRVKEVKNCDFNNVCTTTKYNYSVNNKSTGVLLQNPQFDNGTFSSYSETGSPGGPGYGGGFTPVNYFAHYYSYNNIYPLSPYRGSPVLYSNVEKELLDSNSNSKGKTISEFYLSGGFGDPRYNEDLSVGRLKSEKEYAANENVFLKKIEYKQSKFKNTNKNPVYSAAVKMVRQVVPGGPGVHSYTFSQPYLGKHEAINYPSTQIIDSTRLNQNYIVQNSNYIHDSSSGNLISKTVDYSDGIYVFQSYQYAHEKNKTKLIEANMVGIPLETTVVKKQTATDPGKTISKTYTDYPDVLPDTQTGNLLLPKSVSSLDLVTGNLSTEVTYNQYDSKGSLQQYTSKTGVPTAIIWGYNNTQPIAKIEGATYAQVSSLASAIINASNDDANDAVSGNPKENDLLTALDSFRNNSTLAGFQITTYTYDPLIGVRSITPPSGIREVYVYDTANRLKEVKDVNGNILKSYEYHYKP